MKRGMLFGAACLVALFAGRSFADDFPALSPQARTAYEQGLIAADQQAWGIALFEFWSAERLAPRHPRVLYSLGLAHGKAGHPLAGAAWLRAYLAVAPDAPEAEAVLVEVPRQLDLARSLMRRIFGAAVAAARTIPSAETRWDRLCFIATSMAEVGEFEAAWALEQELATLADKLPKSRPGSDFPRDRSKAQSWIGWAQVRYRVEVRELARAREALRQVASPVQRTSALVKVATGLAYTREDGEAARLLAEAERLTAQIHTPMVRANTLAEIANAYREIGRRDAADAADAKADAIAKQEGEKLSPDSPVETWAYPRSPVDEVPGTWIALAEAAHSASEVVDLAGRLEAARTADQNYWTGSAADSVADKIETIAKELGEWLRRFRAVEIATGAGARAPSSQAATVPLHPARIPPGP